jgi:hypothetical protein
VPAERVHAAVHEAAHAVVGISLGLTVVEIQMGRPGIARYGTDFGTHPVDLARQLPDVMALVVPAGSIAEQLILGSRLEQGWEGDVQILKEGLQLSPEETQLILTERVPNLVHEHRAAIETVAETLLTENVLSGEAVIALMNRARRSPTLLPTWALN